MVRQAGFFDVNERLEHSSDLGDRLEAYVAAVDFEIFRTGPDTAPAYADGGKGGRPPHDPVLMFKIPIVRAQNDLAEFPIGDRLSFMRFPGPGLQDEVPDAKTIRAFRERSIRTKAIERSVRPVRNRPAGCRPYRHIGAIGGRHAGRRTWATQYGRGKERHRGRQDRRRDLAPWRDYPEFCALAW